MRPLLESSVAAATWTAHGKAWREWCSLVGEREVVSSVSERLAVTVDYLLYLREAKVSAAVARRRLCGVSFYFKCLDWDDVTKRFLIQQSLKGWERTHVRRESRRPVSYSLLVSLLQATEHGCSSVYESCFTRRPFVLCFMVRCALVSWFQCLRVVWEVCWWMMWYVRTVFCSCGCGALRRINLVGVRGCVLWLWMVWLALLRRFFPFWP